MSPEREQLVDPETLREQVRLKYRAVANAPEQPYHFHTGRPLAQRLGYDPVFVDDLPDRAVESFAGVGNPFSARRLEPGERVLDVGSGAGLDAFIAAALVGDAGAVIGVDMTTEMLEKARATTVALGLTNVEFRHGLIEELPIDDGWADVVMSNGVINLCADKLSVVRGIWRALRAGGVLQFADIASGGPIPVGTKRDIDLWTGWIAGALPRGGWQTLLEDAGFADVTIGPPIDTFGGAAGEENARTFDVYGYVFLAHKPGLGTTRR